MSRRNARGSRRGSGVAVNQYPELALGPLAAWDVARSVVSGGNVTSIPNLVTGGPAATPVGTVAAPIASANLAGRLALAGSFTASLAIGSTAVSMAFVSYVSGNPFNGMVAATVGGTVNTGQALFRETSNSIARYGGGGTDASLSSAAPIKAVWIGVVEQGVPVRVYRSAVTPGLSAGNAGVLAATTVTCIGALNNAGLYMRAENTYTRAAIWNRALTVAEVTYLLYGWGGLHGIATGP